MKELNNENIKESLQSLSDKLSIKKLARYEVLRLLILTEETLLKYQDEFGSEVLFDICIHKHLFSFAIKVIIQAPKFDCRNIEQSSDIDILKYMVTNKDQIFSWNFRNNCNIVTIIHQLNNKLLDIVKLFSAFIFAIGLFKLSQILPSNISYFISEVIVQNLNNIMFKILQMIASFFVFFSILSSFLNISYLETLKDTIKRIFLRTFLNSIGIIFIFALILYFFISSSSTIINFELTQISNLLINMIPTDFFTPFIDGNIMKITILSVILGIILLLVCKNNKTTYDLVEIGFNVSQFSMRYYCKFIPLLIFLNIYSIIPSFESLSLKKLLLPIILFIGAVIFIIVVETIEVCVFHKIRIPNYIKAVLPGTIVTLTTASSFAAIDNIKNCMKELDIDTKFTDLVLPLELSFYKPFSIVITFVGVLSVSIILGYQISIGTILTISIMALIISFACPSVPGGMLSCLSIICTQLMLPDNSIAILIFISIIFDYIGGALSVYSIQTDIVGLAYRLSKVIKK